jgi:hypothetical protein
MRKLKTKWFAKWARKQKISDSRLLGAIDDMQNSLSSVDLGSGLHKVRVSPDHRGKSSASRVIIVYRQEDRAVMVYGFMKNEQENLTAQELRTFKKLAKDILSLSETELTIATKKKVFIEIGDAE